MFKIQLGKILDSLLSKDSVFGELFKGKEKKLQEFQLMLIEALNVLNLAQIEINKIEARNSNVFVSGWRPSVGWICSFALAYTYILQPFLVVIFQVFDIEIVAPTLQIGELVTILFALLGMGGIRTYEKIKLNKE